MDEVQPTHGAAQLIVAIGASAGGVQALRDLFTHMSDDLGAAFLVVTHLSPDHESHLGEILSRCTSMRVCDVVDGQLPHPNTVYVLPSNAIVTMADERLVLRVDGVKREHNPIDIAYCSVAKEVGERAVGIVLSGSGSDGTLGVRCIKDAGGLTIAQGPGHLPPEHESMPASAIAGGLVDFVLSTDEIGARLREYVHSFATIARAAEDEPVTDESTQKALREVYSTLRKRVGHDFENYKDKTFIRRLQRRMRVLQVDSVPAYAEHLRQEPNEAGLLFRDLLIGVTSFFRDAEAFDALKEKVIPRLFDNAGAADTVRVWVPGCATGEEAYSLAILLIEYADTLPIRPRIQVFATDIDEAALAVARAGRYPLALLQGISKERLQRFFRVDSSFFVLTNELRDVCVFSAHSVIRDPPFSRMDLVSCRNLLIYFNAELQETVLPVFHYALKPGGYVFLGPAENVSRHSDLFSAVDKRHRIFQRRGTATTAASIATWISSGRSKPRPVASRGASHGTSPRKGQQLREIAQTRVLERFAPAHVVVEADGEIIHYSARTGKYLEAQIGSPSRQLLSMARKGLRLELRAALHEAVETGGRVVRERVRIDLDDRVQLIELTIEPLLEGEEDPLYLVIFKDCGPPLTAEQAMHSNVATGISRDAVALEQELHETRDRLQTNIEEYETAVEELKSGNEELVSVNEELQSTNEELETSKEELQSLNEELQTVNHELAGKVDELDRANADLRNLFESTQIATVFLDRFMVIRSYTPAVGAIFNLISSDIGRPITDIAHRIADVELERDIRSVLDERKGIERSVRLRDSKVYHLMRILPYRVGNDEIDGVLITFVNVTAVVVAEEQQRLLVSELNHRVRNMLQVVIGIANQTLHRASSLEEFEKAFIGRVQALSRAYRLLSRDGWHNAPLDELVATQLEPFAAEGARFEIQGESVELTASAALALGLIVYELSTNAVKYGAFSQPSGHIDIHWKVEGDDGNGHLVLYWRERGGPRVHEPTRQGFGSKLIAGQLRHELQGEATVEFAADGLQLRLSIPVSRALVQETPGHA